MGTDGGAPTVNALAPDARRFGLVGFAVGRQPGEKGKSSEKHSTPAGVLSLTHMDACTHTHARVHTHDVHTPAGVHVYGTNPVAQSNP